MSEHLTPENQEIKMPLVTLVTEAYDKVDEHNRGISSLSSLFKLIMRMDALESKKGEVTEDDITEFMYGQATENSIKADITQLEVGGAGLGGIFEDIGVSLVSDRMNMKVHHSEDGTIQEIGNNKLYPVVNDVDKFVEYIDQIDPASDKIENETKLLFGVVGQMSELVYGCYREQYKGEFKQAEIDELIEIADLQLDNFAQIDEVVKRKGLYAAVQDAQESLSNVGTLIAQSSAIKMETFIEQCGRLEDYIQHREEGYLPEAVFLGEVTESTDSDYIWQEMGALEAIDGEVERIKKVVDVNRSPEAIDYASRYLQYFEQKLNNTLSKLESMGEIDDYYVSYYKIEGRYKFSDFINSKLDETGEIEQQIKLKQDFAQIIEHNFTHE